MYLTRYSASYFDMGDVAYANNVMFFANIASTSGMALFISGLVMIICGVISRGVGRIESAILCSRELNDIRASSLSGLKTLDVSRD
jgi:hypothetical protein